MISRRADNVADWLAFAAAPTFAALAVASFVGGEPSLSFCGPDAASLLGGMPIMYLLMSAFHAPLWLRLAARFRPSTRRQGA